MMVIFYEDYSSLETGLKLGIIIGHQIVSASNNSWMSLIWGKFVSMT